VVKIHQLTLVKIHQLTVLWSKFTHWLLSGQNSPTDRSLVKIHPLTLVKIHQLTSVRIPELLFWKPFTPLWRGLRPIKLKECSRAISHHPHKSEIYGTPAAPLKVLIYRSVVTRICHTCSFPVAGRKRFLNTVTRDKTQITVPYSQRNPAPFQITKLPLSVYRSVIESLWSTCAGHTTFGNLIIPRRVSFPPLQTKEQVQVLSRILSSLVHALDMCPKYVGECRFYSVRCRVRNLILKFKRKISIKFDRFVTVHKYFWYVQE